MAECEALGSMVRGLGLVDVGEGAVKQQGMVAQVQTLPRRATSLEFALSRNLLVTCDQGDPGTGLLGDRNAAAQMEFDSQGGKGKKGGATPSGAGGSGESVRPPYHLIVT